MGFLETTEDALLILEAARRRMIPRVTRRLADRERRLIQSGSVFVFEEEESGIKRCVNFTIDWGGEVRAQTRIRRCTLPSPLPLHADR